MLFLPGSPRAGRTRRAPLACVVLAGALVLALQAGGVSGAGQATTLSYGSPESVGMDPEKLDEAVQLYRDQIARDQLRSVVLLVARQGTVVVHEALGWRDQENNLPMERNTLIRMASNTKAPVATAALILAQEGKLSLDDPVAKHIPAFEREGFRNIRVRHLMSNSAGLPRGPIFLSGVRADSNMVREAERFAAALELDNPPGSRYAYSNAGFNILGGVIEAVEGKNLEEVLREKLYQPLGMQDSNNHESTADNNRMAKVYTGRGESTRARWSPGDRPSYPIVRASGGMISTAWDYAVFMQLFLNGGAYHHTRVLTEESVRLATSVQSGTSSYGFGWQVGRDGQFSHGGSDGTHAWADAQRGIIGIVFTQHPGGANPRGEFQRLVNEAIRSND